MPLHINLVNTVRVADISGKYLDSVAGFLRDGVDPVPGVEGVVVDKCTDFVFGVVCKVFG